ncbi:MAG: transcription elongation factor subunit Spt4 [Candidatus Hodarchaeota archaeon]
MSVKFPYGDKNVTKACRDCHRIIETGAMCDQCKTHNLSTSFDGMVIIVDPENSRIAKKLNIRIPGRYALRVR